MNITKKFLSAVTAAMCAATASVCSLSVSAAEPLLSAEKTDGHITYVLVDEDRDGEFDHSRIVDCAAEAVSINVPKVFDNYVVKEIDPKTFIDCTALTTIDVNSQNTYFTSDDGVLYTAGSTELVCFPSAKAATEFSIPNTVNKISDNAFINCIKMEKITIPESVTKIGAGAFGNCEALAKIAIPKSVESIGSSAFDGTKLLKNQVINETGPLYYADSWVIACDSSVTNVSTAAGNAIKVGTTGIAGGSFAECDALTKIDIPAGVYYIGDYAFAGCNQLSSLALPTTVKAIGEGSFAGCTAIVDLPIPNTVSTIGKSAFYGCSKLAEINIPTSVTRIEESTFEGCAALLEIEVPENVIKLEKFAFKNCAILNKITIKNAEAVINDSPLTISNSEETFTGTIYGYKDSSAATYAKTYERLFKEISSSEGSGVKGDANDDGVVNVRDAAKIASSLANGVTLELTADYNGDNAVNVRDAAKIASDLANGILK